MAACPEHRDILPSQDGLPVSCAGVAALLAKGRFRSLHLTCLDYFGSGSALVATMLACHVPLPRLLLVLVLLFQFLHMLLFQSLSA